MIRRTLRLAVALWALCLAPPAAAVTVSLSLESIDREIARSLRSGDGLGLVIGRELQTLLSRAGLRLDEGHLMASVSDHRRRTLVRRCSHQVDLKHFNATVRIDPESGFSVVLDALSRPIVASIDLHGEVQVDGRLKAYYGVRSIGGCWRYQDDSFTVDLNSDVSMTVRLRIDLNPRLVEGRILRISPTLALDGEIRRLDNSVRIRGVDWVVGQILTGGKLDRILGIAVEGAIDRSANPGTLGAELAAQLQRQQDLLRADLYAALGGTSRDYRLPRLGERQQRALANLINAELAGRFPVAPAYIARHADRILFHLIDGDAQALTAIVGSALACEASRSARISMPRAPLYRLGAAGCQAVAAVEQGADYFGDARCRVPVDYRPADYTAFCAEVADPEGARLGDALAWSGGEVGVELPWSTSPASRFDIGTRSIRGNHQPYVKRVAFRNAIGDRVGFSAAERRYLAPQVRAWRDYRAGQFACAVAVIRPSYCDALVRPPFAEPDESQLSPFELGRRTCGLEMRVYKREIGARGLKPLLAVHGGGWKYRGFGFLALESQISHYTERGFVVFAPFYRLSGDAEGPEFCRDASLAQISSDIEAALDWVRANGPRFGADGQAAVGLLGQSAGAHLAAWLSVQRPEDIDRALLFYPPADLGRLLDRFAAGRYDNPAGQALLAELFDRDLAALQPTDPQVAEHSLARRIAASPRRFPDFFLLHGMRDELVPVGQSLALCNARYGDAGAGPVVLPSGPERQQTRRCNGDSWLSVFAEAGHGLDLCVEALDCPAGSRASRLAVAAAMRNASYWLAGRTDPARLIPVLVAGAY